MHIMVTPDALAETIDTGAYECGIEWSTMLRGSAAVRSFGRDHQRCVCFQRGMHLDHQPARQPDYIDVHLVSLGVGL